MLKNNINLLLKKKSQEEMIGFALIIIIVAIIALILLIVVNKRPAAIGEDRELANFLGSMTYYTAHCSISPENNYNLRELIKACKKGERCLDGIMACDVMNETISTMLQEAFPSGGRVKSFYFSIEYNATDAKNILILGNTSCSGKKKAAEFFYPANPGDITIRLQGCY